ncbi:hypothetical protein SS20_09520 [Klebsiella aerogenes]|nr:hypothetical protein SS20_09520 [Klebsiella aerogenes]
MIDFYIVRIGLENRSRGNSTGGSNPPLSATIQSLTLILFSDAYPAETIPLQKSIALKQTRAPKNLLIF